MSETKDIPDEWSAIDIQDLKKLFLQGKTPLEISYKVRRPLPEVEAQIEHLGLEKEKEPQYRVIIPKDVQAAKSHKPADDLPDIGVTLKDINNDIKMLHVDIVEMEKSYNERMDKIIKALNHNVESIGSEYKKHTELLEGILQAFVATRDYNRQRLEEIIKKEISTPPKL